MPSSPDIHIKIELVAASPHHADSIVKALIPDNVKFPKGLSAKMRRCGSKITIVLGAHGIGTNVLLGTLDEVLEHVSVSEKVIG